jgi:iron complex outermembrane receptor protein
LTSTFGKTDLLAASALVVSLSAGAAAAAEPRHAFHLEAGSLDAALMAVTDQTKQQVVYPDRLVQGRSAPALKGQYTAVEALERLLAGTGIQIRRDKGVIVLKPPEAPPPVSIRGVGAASSEDVTAPRDGSLAAAGDPSVVSEIVVTGSHIRGAGPGTSKVVVITRDDIDRRGHGTIAQALAALPQAFGGTPTEETGFTGGDRSNSNASMAAGVNLRGLGADATLVLVNGRRMAFSGNPGDFSDVSALPAVAVERIEVLMDGASALYGSDAVGGVVNVVLRRDFEGSETRLRYGADKDGVAQEFQFGQVSGFGWGSGYALIAYEHYQRDALASSARAFTANSDLRPLGGTDHRLAYAYPGNLLKLDPATLTFQPAYGVPPGQDGRGLTAGSFAAGQINLQNLRQGLDLLPRQERDSLYLAANQQLGARLTLSGDARYSYRHYRQASPSSVGALLVTPANPYFASPDGSPAEFVAYSFAADLGNTQLSGMAKSLGLSAGADLDLARDWRASTFATYAEERSSSRTINQANTSRLAEALGGPDDPATAFSTAVDGYFNPFGALGNSNGPALLAFIGAGYSTQNVRSQVGSANLQADGTLATLPGGPIKLAVGGQVRREFFQSAGESFLSTAAPAALSTTKGRRTVTAAFAELRVPVVGPGKTRTGIERLELSLAGRVEHYDDVGTTADPKLGLVWAPARDWTLRASYGTSFKAPALKQTRQRLVITPVLVTRGGQDVLALLLYGGNAALRPETASAWSAGVDYQPSAAPDLKISLNVFDTRFTRRIGQPALDGVDAALEDPALAPFVTRVDPLTNPDDATRVTALITSPASEAQGLYPAEYYGAIVDGRYVNTASLQVRGLDLDLAYRWKIGEGAVDLSANAAYLERYRIKVTQTASPLDRINLAGYPTALRARLGAFWTQGPWGAGASLSYVDNHHDEDGAAIDNWTSADLQLSWRAPARSGPLQGLELALSVQNVFDTDPPFYDAPLGVGYDSANATALGRYGALRLTKAW